ncbi:MAG TPA: efflux RND transporter periplasmic adaptor subunit [Sulfurimonas sp.]|uniref:efflux RND transporter periplasmic adaptor subunit n=1 Tax=Sulfurimonas sp. TaxID=2022749 RepID=UPI002CED2A9B|nr:efflux RND transporter periplasmic adaptor subunit [Sulfurimonas sp.]HUH42234.1 efflux RND transporter periplasmic adaptor subunit [Sulfurimonas sp.]
MKKLYLTILLLTFNLSAQEIYASFFVKAYEDATLAFNAGGIIKKINADVSHSVKKGALLAELHNEDTKALMGIAKADVDKAEITLKYAQRDYEREQKVKHLVDEARFDTFALAYESAKASLQSAKANLSYREALYKKTTLYAPFDGVIYEKNAEVGDAVTEMSPKSIFKIQSQNRRKLILEFDQKYWSAVKVGQTFKYKIDGDVSEHLGVISKVYPHVNEQNRKLIAEVEVKEFLVGLFGDGYIVTDSKK